jgi:beta-glucosidase
LVRPVKELKAFRKITLAPGEVQTVTFTISVEDLKFFDDAKHEWVAEPGKFTIYIGASSADVRAKVAFEL